MENVALIGGFWQVAVQGLQTSESASYLYNRAHLYLPSSDLAAERST